MTDKVWFITGAGRGLGYLLARDALRAGDRVVATSQSIDGLAESLPPPGDSLLVLPLDVTDAKAASAAHDAAIKTFGRIDVLVNNAGRAQLGWFETIPEEDVRRQFEINLFGAMNVARAMLPTMRRQRSGLVVTISSVILRPDRSSHSITCRNGQRLLALRAATTEVASSTAATEPASYQAGDLDPAQSAAAQLSPLPQKVAKDAQQTSAKVVLVVAH